MHVKARPQLMLNTNIERPTIGTAEQTKPAHLMKSLSPGLPHAPKHKFRRGCELTLGFSNLPQELEYSYLPSAHKVSSKPASCVEILSETPASGMQG